jgi:hypothetical protein
MANGGYYTQDEAMKKLALSKDDLLNLVREGKLREFRVDGQPKYKSPEIDALAAEINPSGGSSDASATDMGSESAIELTPADASDGGTDVVSLEETGDQLAPISSSSKEDTVITPAGVSVFDEDELAGMDADPMAKTQIAPSVTDELSIEGGGGSGLLDMTRESDDTSLGAELLDEIYSGDETQPERAAAEVPAQPEGFEQPEEAAAPMPARMVVQMVDPWSGVFGGLVVASLILLAFTGVVATLMTANVLPGFVGWFSPQIYIWIAVAVVVTGASLGVGYALGKRNTA